MVVPRKAADFEALGKAQSPASDVAGSSEAREYLFDLQAALTEPSASFFKPASGLHPLAHPDSTLLTPLLQPFRKPSTDTILPCSLSYLGEIPVATPEDRLLGHQGPC
jgi:hypothetical protein